MSETTIDGVVESLNRHFIVNHPDEAARHLDRLPDDDVAEILAGLPSEVLAPVVDLLAPEKVPGVLSRLSDPTVVGLLETMDVTRAAVLISRVSDSMREHFLALVSATLAREIRNVLEYPPGSAGRLMDTRISTYRGERTVEEAVEELRLRQRSVRGLRVVDATGRLTGNIDLRDLVIADPQATLASIANTSLTAATPLDPREEVVAKLDAQKLDELPVVDLDGRMLGVIRHDALIDVLVESATVDIQTMVGASRDERALSPSLFAVRKRMPWLQINLLTAFAAASVVGIFENTIATFTALAVLLPVVAGQSGNAGAQALAVTMRGLALREIGIRHWSKVLRKEMLAGLWNGMSIAVTCSIGVYIWSGNLGLVLVIAMSMVISMVAAGTAGALVPISLARIGQDPAVASSIILTTVTDIVGFFSFLGIATLLATMLV